MAPLGAALAQTAPPGMVPYDHPVYHHGKRVLWHWAGRKDDGADPGSADQNADSSNPGNAQAKRQSWRGRPEAGYNFSVFSDGDDATAFRMASDIVGAVKAAGLRAHPTVGRTNAASLQKLVVSDIADFVVAPVDALVDDPNASWKDRAPYVLLLGLERIEIVAGKGIAKVADLEGKPVAVGPADSADEAVAAGLFQRLGVKPEFVRKPLTEALADLAAGKVAAVMATGEAGSKALGEFGKDGKWRLVPLPMTPALASAYSPLTLTAKDRPNLVGPDEKIVTLGAPIALVAMDVSPFSPRARRDAAFVAALFEQFPTLLSNDADPEWRHVNIAAALDWPRLASADAWISGHRPAPNPAVAGFHNAANANPAPSAEQLFESLMQARSAEP